MARFSRGIIRGRSDQRALVRHGSNRQTSKVARPANRDLANATTGVPTGFKIKSR